MGLDRRSTSGCPGYGKLLVGMDRRGFLRAGTLAALGPSLSGNSGAREAQGTTVARAQSVLLLYAMGGISHHDSFDPKPEAPAEIRGEFRTIPTKLPGVRFSEKVPRLAGIADRFALIRSVQHAEHCHGVGAYYMLRGHTEPSPFFDRPENQDRAHPTIGAQIGRLRGSRDGLPPYICVPGTSYLAQINYYTAGWLGRAYDPFVLRADPNLPAFSVSDLGLPDDVPPARLHRRLSLAQALDRSCRDFEASAAAKAMTACQDRAFGIVSGGTFRQAFDLGAEPVAVRDAYGRTRLGQSCLLARRLVEAGVPFVTVDDDGWDHHGQIFSGLSQRLPDLDRSLSALIGDLGARGLLQTTLVAVLTDFGRTPRVNSAAGRDHWPGVFSVLLAGAGVSGRLVLGASDRIGARPSDHPVSPSDLAATVYHLLGIDPARVYRSREGRPFKILDAGEVIQPLL